VDRLVDAWIREGRFANRSEVFRAGIFALKDKLAGEAFETSDRDLLALGKPFGIAVLTPIELLKRIV
jgi:Arc/MetJ-type ribon-helix-helix transcriptional regulator